MVGKKCDNELHCRNAAPVDHFIGWAMHLKEFVFRNEEKRKKIKETIYFLSKRRTLANCI